MERINNFAAVLSPSTSDSDDSDYSPKTRKLRPKSTSFIALRDAVYQLTCLNDFSREKIGGGFFADVYKVSSVKQSCNPRAFFSFLHMLSLF